MAPTYVVDHEPPEKESHRLNVQHEAIIENYGYLLPPTVPLDGVKAIADIATGTGIFLTQLAKQLPADTVLHGYDINDALFPDASTLPPNISFSKLSVLKDVPEDLYEKYDLVHVRGLCMVLKSSEWEYVVKNLKKIIKPGGYLVWTDTSIGTTQPFPVTHYAKQVCDIMAWICTVRGGDPYIMDKLPSIFTDNNFSLIPTPKDHILAKDFKEDTKTPFSENYIRGLCSVISYMSVYKVPNQWFEVDKATEFAQRFIDETQEGKKVHVLFDLWTVVGKKEE